MKRTETKHKTKNRLLTTNIVLALILLVSANLLLGTAISIQSRMAVRSQVEQRMLDIANTAADALDSDVVARLQPSDLDTQKYQDALDVLRMFQENIGLSYIYCVRKEAEDSYIFTIDPDTADPAEFGEHIAVTAGLRTAGKGTPAVDRKAHTDKWGRFYSAYSPVLDSQGNVVSVVGVDFDADWYDKQLVQRVSIIAISSIVSLGFGLLLAYAITRRSYQRFRRMEQQMQELSQGFDTLNRTMMRNSVDRLDHQPQSEQNDLLRTIASGEQLEECSGTDEMCELGQRLRSMQGVMQRYIAYLDTLTYRDELTGVGSKLAYKKTLKEIDEEISAQQAIFAVGFFDINDLQNANTQYGFEVGDKLLIGTADVLMRVFGRSNVYRVASDEFIAILRGKNTADMEDYFEKFVAELDRFNEKKSCPVRLTVAKGSSVYYPDRDENYREVFRIAEEAQERDKARYHQLKANT